MIPRCGEQKTQNAPCVECVHLVKMRVLFAIVLGLILLLTSCSRKKITTSEGAISSTPAAQIDDPVASFQRGVATVEQRKDKIFPGGNEVEITYDVTKTNSLVTPIIGTLRAKIKRYGYSESYDDIYEFQFSYQNGRWTLEKSSNYLRSDMSDSSGVLATQKVPEYRLTDIQACF
jgi:hypothetical protein